MISQNGIETAADVQQRHVVLSQVPELHEALAADSRIVDVDARNFVGVRGGPREGIPSAAAHADKRRLFRETMLFREECVPGVPLLAGIAQDEADVKTALE